MTDNVAEAPQQVIADLQRRLDESLAQQAATADVLKIISRSTFDLQAVLETLITSAVKLCGASRGAIFLREGEVYPLRAASSATAEFLQYWAANPPRAGRGSATARVIASRRVEVIADVLADPEMQMPVGSLNRIRGTLGVPMLRDDKVEGVMVLTRPEPGPFTQSQIDLVQTFADQAMIAIENTRLFTETKESLDRQTATSEILKVIASSPNDVQPVFDSIVESAATLFAPCSATITMLKEGQLHWNASAEVVPTFDHERARAMYPIPFDPKRSPSTKALLERRIVEIPDISAPETPEFTRRIGITGGFRSITFVPLISKDTGIGTIILTHPAAGFRLSQRQLDLVQTFADQAVIAIENVRLFDEVQAKSADLQESLQHQTATSEVLKVISRAPGELDPVFQTILASATTICDAQFGLLLLYEDGGFRCTSTFNLPPAFAETFLRNPVIYPPPIDPLGRLIETRQLVHVIDVKQEPAYLTGFPPIIELVELGGARTLLLVPMLRENDIVGVIAIFRQTVHAFTDKQIDLVKSFANQAVIAIENARLLGELRQRTKELSLSLEELRTAQDRLIQTEKLASLGQLTAGIAHEIKNPLNFVNNFSALSAELVDELNDALGSAAIDVKARSEIDELTSLLKGNLEKVVQHGRRADSIVKNMLVHSREGSGEHRSAAINAIVEESLNLAYHGARAEKSGFNIALSHDLDPSAGMIDVYPQEITRVLLNLISNGFYAATKRKEAGDGGFEPSLTATTKNLGNKVEIRIRDNGTGIAPEVQEKMFNPFFTTKPAGEGTGLGLSMSHDIVVKQHGGRIDVDTEPGQFTEFIITLPRAAAKT